MAWDDDMPATVRVLLQDVGTTQVYQDSGLIQVILISAMQVKGRFQFDNPYSVSISNETLSPDPTSKTTKDDAFMLLTCYTAVVTLIKSEIRSMTRQGISIQDGDSKVSLQRDPKSLQLMLDSYQKDLDDLIYAYLSNGGEGFGEVIVTPYPIFSWGYEHHDRHDRSWL